MEGIQTIPQELILPFLFRAKIASILGLLPFSVNLRTCRIQRGNLLTRLTSYFHLFGASLRLAGLGTQTLEVIFMEGETTRFSLLVSVFSVSMFATAAHIELCHVKSNDFIVLFNSLKFEPVTSFKFSWKNFLRNVRSPLKGLVLKWRHWLGNVRKVMRELRKLGITGLVLVTEPIGGFIFVVTQFLNSVENPGSSKTHVFGYLTEKWKTSSGAVVVCAIYDAFMNLFLINSIALMVVIILTVRIAYFEPVERFLIK